MCIKILLIFIFSLAFGFVTSERLLLTVAYCPTFFASRGALVEVSPLNGSFTVVKTFEWPKPIRDEGCIALDDPTFAFHSQKNELLLDFLEELGLMVVLNLKDGSSRYIQPKDPFFTGFENMHYVSHNIVKGLTATVDNTPEYCHDGCFALGMLNVDNGEYKKLSDIPFKAIMDDVHYYDKKGHSYWVQGSYDLRPINETCAPRQSDLCLLNLDIYSGDLKSSQWTNWTVYDYAQMNADGSVLAFLEGFDKLCNHPYNNFLFAKVWLTKAYAIPIACIPQSVIIHEGPWMSAFSSDQRLFATASGDAEGNSQLLVLNTANGAVVVNKNIDELGQVLKAANGLFWIWALTWIPN